MEEFSIEEDDSTMAPRHTAASTLLFPKRRGGPRNGNGPYALSNRAPGGGGSGGGGGGGGGFQTFVDKFLGRFSRKACYLTSRYSQGE